MELVRTILRGYLEEYAEADEILIQTPEHPHADRTYRTCWEDLCGRHRIDQQVSLNEVLEHAHRESLAPAGAGRAEREIKSAVTMLHFFESLMSSSGELIAEAESRKTRLGLSLGAGFADFTAALPRVLWPNVSATINLGYTASRAVRRISAMRKIDASQIDIALILTLQDDNVGSMPQAATAQHRILLHEMHRLGWRGYFTRYWPIGDLDPAVAYLSRTSWEEDWLPQQAYTDHARHAYGASAADCDDFLSAMQILEDATIILDMDFLGLLFPASKSLIRYIEKKSPMPEGLFHVRAMYVQARQLLRRMSIPSQRADATGRYAYLLSRLEFAIEAINEIELLCEAGVKVASGVGEEARPLLQCAADAGRRAMRATAAHVRDDSDRGTLAIYGQLMIRDIEAFNRELK
jgi:hypothetical protein